MITLLGELGQERGPPFVEGGELSPELFQLAVDLCQFGPRLCSGCELALASNDPRRASALGQQASGAFREIGAALCAEQAPNKR
jgi:hypothetical protein